MGGDTTITNDVLAERMGGLHDDLGRIELQLSKLVPREVYDAHRVADAARIVALETRASALEARGRWLLASVLIPVAAIVVMIWLSSKGVKP